MELKNKISINFPLRGEWKFLRPPGHHPFAFDFVKMNKARSKYSRKNKISFFIGSIQSSQYYSWQQPVFSPIDGRVLQMGTGCIDHVFTNLWQAIKLWFNATYRSSLKTINGRLDIRPNVGNYIMLEANEGYIVFLAHLKNSSIQVQEGQLVKSGDLLAHIGNSGNSTAPHLHINVFDQMQDPLKAKVLPFVFRQYEELNTNNEWQQCYLNVPKVRSFVRI